ncbi:MAG: oligopeptide transport system substrate-binding protein [Limisphaerales bacterium]|jgi:oligopeptide transport system substrate-binding protein
MYKNSFTAKHNPIFTLFILPAMLLSSCAGESNNSNSIGENAPQVFQFNLSAEVTSLDPAFADNQANTWAAVQLYNGLVRMNDQMQIEADLAESWEISEDGLSFLFELKPNILFHPDQAFEGVEAERLLTASDVVFSFKRLLDPELAADGSWIFADLIDPKTGFEVLSERSLKITLDHPFQAFLSRLTMPYCSVVSKHATEFYNKEYRKNPVGTGPFKLTAWKEGEQLLLSKNKDYFRKDKDGNSLPYLDGVRMTFLNSKSTEFLQFENKDLDFVSDLDASLMSRVLDNKGNLNADFAPKYKLIRGQYFNTEYLGFDLSSVPSGYQNQKVRQAINMGFDRKKMINSLRNGKGIPASGGMVPPVLLGVDHVKYGYKYNPQIAGQLLAEAGYPGAKGLPEITLRTNDQYLDLCSFIARQLQDIGIKVKTETVEGKILREWMVKGSAGFFRASWIVDYPDPESYLALFYSKHGAPPNYTRFNNAEFDVLYEEAIAQTDNLLRTKLYREMDSIVMSVSSVIPLYYDEILLLCQPNIEGLKPNPMNLLKLEEVRKNNPSN